MQSTEYSTDGGASWAPVGEAGVSFTDVGTHTVQYRSLDAAGNVEATKEVTLGGSTVPLKFRLFSGDQELTSTTAIDSLKSVQHSCDPAAATDAIETVVSGETSVRHDTQAGQLQYNWKTPKGTAGCFDVIVRSLDGPELKAQFRLK